MWIRTFRLVLLIFGIIVLEDLDRKIMGVENLIRIHTRNLECMKINQDKLDKNNKHVYLGKTHPNMDMKRINYFKLVTKSDWISQSND